MKPVLLTGLFVAAIIWYSPKPEAVFGGDLIGVNIRSTADETLSGKWELQPVLASDTAAGKIPTISFDLAKHKYTGNTGCNAMSGNFDVKADSLRFDEQIISTKIACEGYNEKAFLDNLLKTNRYQIKKGVLQLMYNATVLSNWVRHGDTSSTKQI